MPLDVNSETLEAAADEYGIELTDGGIEEHLRAIEAEVDSLGDLDANIPQNPPVGAVEPGTDEWNAFLYRFDLSGDGGDLAGLRVGVKDNIAVSGVPMTCGSDVITFVPPYHAPVVERVLDEGATVVGTTNMDEFAHFTTSETCAHGPVENPNAEGHVAGGSSGGSGAAVAAGLVDVAFGTDTGGSIRIPASFCGVVGFKPTYGTVPRFGVADLAPSLDHVGPLADSVANATRVLETVRGRSLRDLTSIGTRPDESMSEALDEPVDGLSVAVVTEGIDGADDDVVRCVRGAVDELRDAGVGTDTISLSGFEEMRHVLSVVTGTEFASLMSNDGLIHGLGTGYSEPWRRAVGDARSGGTLGDVVRSRLVIWRAISQNAAGRYYAAAQNVRHEFTRETFDALEAYDALVLPTTRMTAPAFGQVTTGDGASRTLANTAPFDLTGHPALSVPCGEVDGKPVGFQIVTDWYDESTAVRLGATAE